MPYVKYILIESSNVIGSYILWIFIHYFATQLYVGFCANWSIKGLIMSPFLVTMPHCVGLLWCINQGVYNLQAMWILLGYWLVKRINPLILNKEKKHD